MAGDLPDIKPQTPIASLSRDVRKWKSLRIAVEAAAPVLGMSPTFIRRVCGKKDTLSAKDLLALLDQDAFAETLIPRSKVIAFFGDGRHLQTDEIGEERNSQYKLHKADALKFIRSIPTNSIRCVVTSTPYWALRIYKESHQREWADGESCPFGHEQTPEAFLRHTCEILFHLKRVLADDGSIWWNVMDSFNTRTQIRGNAAEALKAMQGRDKRKWTEHDCRRYSAGHSYLKDGEQCLIPGRIAERASRMGFYVKSIITWAKASTLPEPQDSRVSRNLEYILHLTKQRTPLFDKSQYRTLPAALGGRNNGWETDKLSDVWTLPTSNGRDGHGAQFPVALPGRCIALSTREGDLVLDPFVGAGNSGVAAVSLGRRFIGCDVAQEYLDTAGRKLSDISKKVERGLINRVIEAIEDVSQDAAL